VLQRAGELAEAARAGHGPAGAALRARYDELGEAAAVEQRLASARRAAEHAAMRLQQADARVLDLEGLAVQGRVRLLTQGTSRKGVEEHPIQVTALSFLPAARRPQDPATVRRELEAARGEVALRRVLPADVAQAENLARTAAQPSPPSRVVRSPAPETGRRRTPPPKPDRGRGGRGR
jgi:hypothetical protein